MPLVAGGLLISVLLFLQVLGLISLHRTSLPLVRGLLGGWAEQRGFRRWFLRAIGADLLANAIAWVVHRVRQSVARAAAANLDAVTLYLHDASVIAHHTYKELGEIMPSWANSFGIFRHHTLPTAIRTGVLPAEAGAARAGKMAGKSISVGNLNRIRFGRSIDKLRKELGLLAGILLGIDILVKGLHARGHHHDHMHTLPDAAAGAAAAGAEAARLGRVTTRHDALLKRLAKLLTVVGFGALLWRVLLRWKLGWLRCTKWRRVGPAICGMDASLLEDLLAGILLFTGTVSLVDFAKALQGVVGVSEQGLRDLIDELK